MSGRFVNGKEIKRDEVEKYYRTRISPEGQEPSQEEALSLKLNVIDELINNENPAGARQKAESRSQ